MEPQNIGMDANPPEDEEMAVRARTGDTEAFGELLRRHRAKAVGWARGLAGDSTLAEDIVQEAFIKAFLHVGSLVSPDRFVGWLRQIVKNEANMKLRRGGPYRREQPISSFAVSGEAHPSAAGEGILEKLLLRLGDGGHALHADTEPLRMVLRQEWLQLFRALLRCLNERERGMFEAYFLMHFSAEEVAAMYGTTTGSVHTYLHRSKKKVQEQDRAHHYALSGGPSAVPVLRKNGVSMPAGIPDVPDTFIDRIGKLLRARGETAPAAELIGRSGHAFRMKMSRQTTYADGFFIFDWKKEILEMAGEYGYDAVFLTGQLEGSPVPLNPVSMLYEVLPADEHAVMPFIRHFIDRGCPVLYFDTFVHRPYVHEWNVIYSYNDLERTVELTDVSPPYRKTLAYTELAESPLRFLCGLQKKKRAAKYEDLVLALQSVIRHTREGDRYMNRTIHSSYSSGLQAYDTWIRHLDAGPRLANAYGHKYLAHVHAHSRAFAGRYLRSLSAGRYAEQWISDAASYYDQAAELLRQLSLLTPLLGESCWTGDILKDAAALLEKVKTAEQQAVLLLEEAVRVSEAGYNEQEEQR